MKKGYNERLFSEKSIRGKLHYARYYWLNKKIIEYYPNAKTVLELGCFDAKTINFLPSNITLYQGFDANWEGGFDIAIEKYRGNSKFQFKCCRSLEEFSPSNNAFDISICMETLEHLPSADLESYINKLYEATKNICFVTVPNEKGMVLLAKYFIKKIILKHAPEKYSCKELFNGFLGKMNHIKRREGGHKGFDYLELINKLNKKFIVEEISGIPLSIAPKSINFTIGIVLRKENDMELCV